MDNLFLFIAASLLLLAGHVIRAARWALLFQPNQIFRRFDLLLGLAFGYAINAVLPWRIGELARIWFVARRESLRVSTVAPTVVAERLSDLLAAAAIGAVLMLMVDDGAGFGWKGPILMVVLAVLGLWFAVATRRYQTVRRMVWRLASVFNDRIRFGVVDFAWSFSEVATSGALLRRRFLLTTVLMWGFYVSSYVIFARAAAQSLNELIFSMIGVPFRAAATQAMEGEGAAALALLGFTIFPVLGILIYGGVKQYPAIKRLLNARRRYGWYDQRDVVAGVRNKFKADSEYEYFLVSLFSGDNKVATSFGLEAIDDGAVSKLFAGGSDAITALVEVDAQLVIRKFAVGAAGEKLKLQHDWLRANKTSEFPLVDIVRERPKSGSYYYDMPLVVPSNDFYDFIHTSPVHASQQIVREVTARVSAFHQANSGPDADENLLRKYLADKAVHNAKIVLEFAKTIFSGNEYTINNRSYDLKHWEHLLDVDWLTTQIVNRSTTVVHGDLTIENIIVAPQMEPPWYIIDPNPENVFNTGLIDWAKLMQSVHLGYEGLNRNFACMINGNAVQLAFTKSQAYTELHSQVETLITDRFGKDGLREVYFHELINYLRLTPYKIRQDPRKGACFFACTSILLDRYLQRAR